MACSAAPSFLNELLGVVAIAYPYSVTWFLTLFNSSHYLNNLSLISATPKLFVMGTGDNWTSVKSFEKLVEKYGGENHTVELLKDLDHFFFNDEKELILVVDNWAKKNVEGFKEAEGGGGR